MSEDGGAARAEVPLRPPRSFDRGDLWIVLGLLFLGYFLFFHQIGLRDIWYPDEDEYALVNREMVEDGHWIFPTANGARYSIKPPFFNWVGSGIGVLLGGESEFATRLPSAIAAMLGIVFLYLFGRLLWNPRAGLFAALILATTPLYVEFARWIQINMMSTMLFIATLLCFYWGYTNEKRRKLAYLLGYVPIGIGTLNMGLVNVAMPVIVIGVFLLLRRDWKHILQLQLPWGALIFLAIAAPWYATVSIADSYGDDVVWYTNFTRYFGEFAHARPFYYYFTTVPFHFIPWVFFLPGAIYAFRTVEDEEERKSLLFLVVWAVAIFMFFSLSRTKRSEYVLPLFPALALLVGYFIDRLCGVWADSEVRARWFDRAVYALAALFALAAIGAPIYSALAAEEWLPISGVYAGLFALGALSSLFFVRKQRADMVVLSIVLLMTGGVGYGARAIVEMKNDVNSVRGFCTRALDFMGHEETIKMYKWYSPAYAYYTHRFIEPIWEEDQLLRLFESEEPVFAVMKEHIYEQLTKTFPLPTYVVHLQFIDHRNVVLVSNRPSSEAASTSEGVPIPRGGDE